MSFKAGSAGRVGIILLLLAKRIRLKCKRNWKDGGKLAGVSRGYLASRRQKVLISYLSAHCLDTRARKPISGQALQGRTARPA